MRHRSNGMLCLVGLGFGGPVRKPQSHGGIALTAVIRPVCVGACVVAGGAYLLLHCCQQADKLAPASQTDALVGQAMHTCV